MHAIQHGTFNTLFFGARKSKKAAIPPPTVPQAMVINSANLSPINDNYKVVFELAQQIVAQLRADLDTGSMQFIRTKDLLPGFTTSGGKIEAPALIFNMGSHMYQISIFQNVQSLNAFQCRIERIEGQPLTLNYSRHPNEHAPPNFRNYIDAKLGEQFRTFNYSLSQPTGPFADPQLAVDIEAVFNDILQALVKSVSDDQRLEIQKMLSSR